MEPHTASIESWLGDIYAYFRRLGVDAATADDLTQETFIIAWQNYARLRAQEKLRSWLYGIAYRCYLKQRSTAAARVTVELTDELIAGGHDPADDTQLNVRAIHQALQTLPERYLHPLVLIYWEELSYLEAAGALAIPLGTLAWRVHKGLHLLRHALAVKGAHDEILYPKLQTARTITSPGETKL